MATSRHSRQSSPLSLPGPVADTANAPLQPPSRILGPETQVPQPDSLLAEPKPNSPANKDSDGEPGSLRLRFPGWLALPEVSCAPPSPGSVPDGFRRCGRSSTFLTVDYISQKFQWVESQNSDNTVLTPPLGEGSGVCAFACRSSVQARRAASVGATVLGYARRARSLRF